MRSLERPHYPLNIIVIPREQLSVIALYDTGYFTVEAIARLCAAFERALSGIISMPQRRLSAIDVLDATERQKLLVQWNATARAYPRERTIVDLFEAQALRAPQAEAVSCGQERLSYGELNVAPTVWRIICRASAWVPMWWWVCV